MTELLSALREPPVVGRFYMVPVVTHPYHAKVDAWPVIGAMHTDVDFFKFHLPHYHIDARFLTSRQERYLLSRGRWMDFRSLEEIVGAFPLSHRMEPLPKGRPPLARLKCRRASYGNAYTARDEVKALQAHYGDGVEAIALTDGRKLCPHRKADLSQFPADADGMVTCPLHGLRVCVARVLEAA